MLLNPLNQYAVQFQKALEQYEQYVQEQNHLTKEYITKKQETFKWLDAQIKLEFERLQSMNIADVYLNTLNMSLSKSYWQIYTLWLEKMKSMYDLDTEYFKNLIVSTNPIAHNNPFLKMYNIFDVYNHFNYFKNLDDQLDK